MSLWQWPGMMGQIPLISANRHVHKAERLKRERQRERRRRINECDHVTELLLDMTQIEAEAQNADYGKSGTFFAAAFRDTFYLQSNI